MEDVVLSIRDLHKIYPGGVHAVRGVDFDVHEGESVAIIGSSGSGKSTVLRCINRLIEPTEGVIELRGQQINSPSANVNEVRSRIGMVFQSFELFSHLKVLDNVTLGLRHVRGMSKSEAEAVALEVLERVDMLERSEAYPGNLSGGQKQRVAIARALAMKPEVILFDEPTSALDPELIGSVLQTIRGLADEGMTMVIVTHEINFARDVADRIVYLDKGKVAEEGPSSIINQPKTERLQKFLSSMHEENVGFLDHSLCSHCICNLEEASDICTCNIVSFHAVFCGSLRCLFVNIHHYRFKPGIYFFTCP